MYRVSRHVFKKVTLLFHSNNNKKKREREAAQTRSTGVDVEINGEDQNGVNGEEDESVNSYCFSIGFKVTEVYPSVVSWY